MRRKKKSTAKKTASESKTGQPVEDYRDLSANESAADDNDEALGDTAAAEAEQPADEPVLNLKAPYAMVWHDGLKHYYQDGKIFNRGDKKYICEG